MDNQIQQAMLGAPGTPATPYPELQKYYDINFQLPLSNAGVKVLSGQAQARGAQQEFDTKQQIQQAQDKAEGRGYTQVAKNDGGYGFFDPNGGEISANQYARATGKRSFDVLKDSDNPIDVQYIRDYSNLQDFLDASMNGDQEVLSQYYKENPLLKKMKPADVIKRFQQAYPTVYGLQHQGQKTGQTFIPGLRQSVSGGVGG